jgi:hypothetical protein
MDRFHLEDKIIKTSIFADHLRDLAKNIMDQESDTDEIINALEGIAILIELHERSLFNCFCEVFKLDNPLK